MQKGVHVLAIWVVNNRGEFTTSKLEYFERLRTVNATWVIYKLSFKNVYSSLYIDEDMPIGLMIVKKVGAIGISMEAAIRLPKLKKVTRR